MKQIFTSIIYFLQLFSALYGGRYDAQCVEMDIDIVCRELNYNNTLVPNVKMGLDTMNEAKERLGEFRPLLNADCYVHFKYFICNMYLPICHTINNNPTPVYPCRHVCEAARAGCEPVMNRFNFAWPEHLQCGFLREKDSPGTLCGSPPEIQPTKRTVVSKTTVPKWVQTLQRLDITRWIESANNVELVEKLDKVYGIKKTSDQSLTQMICSLDSRSVYIKKDEKEFCPSRCGHHHPYTTEDVRFATVWLSVWSGICFISTTLTVTTFLIDHKRFIYPERPIIFLSFCYNLYSIGYLIRVFGGYDQIVCKISDQGKHVVIEGMSVTSCTLVFFFLYFFGMASALWWVILSLTWFLSAALKWGHEAIEKYSSIFHAISWTVPTIQTIIALVTRKVDADKLSGLCYIGNNNSNDLLLFVGLPLLVYLLIGTIFLCLGFIALIKIRKILSRQRNTSKLERLMLRIGIFSVLYSVPASVVVGCFIHEYNRLKTLEKKSEDILSCIANSDCMKEIQPKVAIFYLRYFMLLVVGVTSGVWIWTSKTLSSWKRFYRNICGKNKEIDERKKLYKKQIPANQRQQQPDTHRVFNNDQLLQSNVATTAPSTFLGSSNNMSQHVYMSQTQPTHFFYPISQSSSGFIQARNVPISHAKLDNNSRGYTTVTPMSSNLPSDIDEASHYNFDTKNHNYASPYSTGGEFGNPPPSKNYSSHSGSDHHSVSHSSQAHGTLPRTIRQDPPASPQSISTARSLKSNESSTRK